MRISDWSSDVCSSDLFLLDLNLTGRIARAAPRLAQGTVIEIGPGPGGLTRALLAEGAARVVAIEKDRRCLDALAELGGAYPGRLEVVEADALKLDLTELDPAPRQIVSNLPYNISTALLVRWLTALAADPGAFSARSEEHTSELQSLMRISYAVFCLKNKTNNLYT